MRNRSRNVGGVVCVVLVCTTAASAQSRKAVEISEAPSVQGFSVTLVLGDMQGTSTPDSLPAGAQKALVDMRDFLPYKSYRLLDTQWILCCGHSKGGAGVSGRLRGVGPSDGQVGTTPVYAFAVNVVGVSGAQLSIKFVLNEGPFEKYAAAKMEEEATIALMNVKQEQEALAALLVQTRKQHKADHPSVRELENRLQVLEAQTQNLAGMRAGSSKGSVIDSTFSMDVGETVVIGTSSLKGNKALIALLTAVPRRGSQAPTEREER